MSYDGIFFKVDRGLHISLFLSKFLPGVRIQAGNSGTDSIDGDVVSSRRNLREAAPIVGNARYDTWGQDLRRTGIDLDPHLAQQYYF
jgi:hypothetical protein